MFLDDNMWRNFVVLTTIEGRLVGRELILVRDLDLNQAKSTTPSKRRASLGLYIMSPTRYAHLFQLSPFSDNLSNLTTL